MIDLNIQDFVNRVVSSQERVQFSQVDPYGHLNASRYVEFIINHRITAIEEQLAVYTLDLMKSVGAAFVVARMDTRYHLPSFMGETLEIASWVSTLHDWGFELRVVVSGTNSKKVRTSASVEIRTVDPKTGRPVRCPAALPSRAESNPLLERPLSTAYLEALENVPEWLKQ